MSGWNMPDGCTQADLDRAFDNLGEPDEPEVVRLDCGHWDTEDHADKVGDRIVCGNCYHAEAERVAGDTQAFDRLKASLQAHELSSYAFNNHGNDAKLYNGIHDLETRMAEAASHLRTALLQSAPSDDQIILGHVGDALRLLDRAAAVRRNPPICPECNEPSGVTGQHKEGCSRI